MWRPNSTCDSSSARVTNVNEAASGEPLSGKSLRSDGARRAARLWALIVVWALALATLSSCGGGLSGDSTCSEYLQASSQDQEQAVSKLVSQLHAEASLLTPLGFPEVAYQCGSNPDETLVNVIRSVRD